MPTGNIRLDFYSSLIMGVFVAALIAAVIAALGSANVGVVYFPIVRGILGFGAAFVVIRSMEHTAGFTSPTLSWAACIYTIIALTIASLIAMSVGFANDVGAARTHPIREISWLPLAYLIYIAAPIAIGAIFCRWYFAD